MGVINVSCDGFIEELSSSAPVPSRIPIWKNDGTGFSLSSLPLARLRNGLFGTAGPGSATTWVADGVLNIGGVSSDTPTNAFNSVGYICSFTTSNVSGTKSGWANTTAVCSRTSRPFVVFRFQPQANTTERIFVGLTDATNLGASRTNVVASDDPAGDFLGLQYSTPRGDTTWHFVTKQSGGAQNLVNTGITVGTVTYYLVVDARDSSQVVLRLFDIAAVELANLTVSTAGSLPLVATGLGFVQEIETEAAFTRTLRCIFAQLSMGETP